MYIDKIKNFLRKLNLKGLIFVYILLMTVMPIVPRATSTFLTTYFYMAVVVVAAVFSFVACRLGCIKEYMLFLLPFIAYEVIAMLFMHNQEVLLAGYQVLLFLLPVFLGYYLITHIFNTQMYTILVIVIVCITCITTIIGCIRNPEAARTLASTKTSQDPIAILYEWQNIGGYGFVYSTVLMYPFVILAFKMKKLHLAFVILFTALVYYMVIQAEYTYALMLLMLTTMMFFIKRDIPLKNFIILMLSFVLIVLVFRVAIAAILSYFGELIGNQTMVDKINAAFLGTDAVDSFDDNRDQLYLHSIEMFLHHPVLGQMTVGRTVTGGHSFILDNLALYGMVGGGLMVWMYRGIYQLFYKPMEGKNGYYIIFWAFVQPIILSTINTGMWLANLCMFTPIFICAIYGKEAYLSAVKPPPTPQIPVKTLRNKDLS